MALVIWKCYEGHFKHQLREIPSDEVIEEHEKNEKWLGSLEKVDSRFLSKRILNGADYKQRYILQYIVETIFESGGEDIHLTPDEEGSLFIILKVHMNCLDLAVKNLSE